VSAVKLRTEQLRTMLAKGKFPAISLLTFGAGLAVTAMLMVLVDGYQRTEVRNEFARDTARVFAQTDSRLRAHFETLRSLKGLFAANEGVDRRQFRLFLEQLNLQHNHPGFQAIQFVRHVPDDQLERYLAAVRADRSVQPQGYPDFKLKPDTRLPDHYVIEYTEPMEGNAAALGVDIAAMPTHRTAVELARDTGRPVATERVKLVQDPLGQPAFVARMPIYRNGLPIDTVEQRRAALFGFAATVYRVNDLMKEVIDSQLVPHMRIQIFDTGYADDISTPRPNTIMFDSKEAYGIELPGLELAGQQARRELTVGQRRWELRMTALDGARYGRDHSATVAVGVSGMVISALIAILLVALMRHRVLSSRLRSALGEQKAIVDNATVGIEFISDRRIHRCNRGMAEILGYSVGELEGSPTRIKYPSDAADAEMSRIAYAAISDGRSWIGEVEWVRKDGQRIWCRLHGKSLVPAEPERGSIWVSYDITAQKCADAALQDANKGLEQGLAQIERTQRDFILLSECSAYLQACPDMADALDCICGFALKLFPCSAGAIYLMTPDKQSLTQCASWGLSELVQPHFPTSECWAMRRGQANRVEQEHQALHCPHLCGTSGQVPQAAICLPLAAHANTFGLLYLEHHLEERNASAEQRYRRAVAWAEGIGLALANLQLRETLRQQSIRDPLTGLFNRRHMNDVIEREFARAARAGAMVALAVIDVDHFKRINDSYGHDTGDVVLKAVASTIAGQVRECDIVCRFGGEEFVAILTNLTPEAARLRAEQIRLAIGKLDCRHGEHIVGTVTASLGLALYPAHGSDEAALVHAADAALYQAKQGGRNRVVMAGQLESIAVA
jgi:diguanylate cyclase (GGDEF)-like protein/PAS domain S-box-containing protein